MARPMCLFASVACIVALVMCCHVVPTDASTQATLKCPAGYQPSLLTACRPPAVPIAPATGAGLCCSCPFGQYSSTAGSTCKSGSTISGVNLQRWGSQCFCIDGFGDYDPNAQTCRRCPANTYSYNQRCTACPAGTYASPQSSSCAPISCPLNSYLAPGGSTISDCTRCKFGTAGQACNTIEACRCLTGYAGFDKTTGQCTQCAGNSIAVYSNMVAPDAANTTCFNCPLGLIASVDRRTCVAPIKTVSTTISITTITASTPVPQFPIPPAGCPCTNGYDYTVTLSNGVDTVSQSLAHTADIDHSSVTSGTTAASAFIPDAASITAFTLIDADTNLAVGLVQPVNSNAFKIVGADSVQLWPATGMMCDQVRALSQVTNFAMPCIKVSQSTATVSVASQIAAQFGQSVFANKYDMKVAFSCSTAPAIANCGSYELYLTDFNSYSNSQFQTNLVFSMDSTGVTLAGPGSGSSKFGNKVVAFYDQTNTIRVVLAQPTQASAGNYYMTTVNAAIGGSCPSTDPSISCVPLNVQPTPISTLLNSIAPDASPVGADLRVTTHCKTAAAPSSTGAAN